MSKLPCILLVVSDDGRFANAAGESEGIPWSVGSEYLSEDSGRSLVKVDGRLIADVTVHNSTGHGPLTEEVQAVSAALVWSGLRSAWLRTKRTQKATMWAHLLESDGNYGPTAAYDNDARRISDLAVFHDEAEARAEANRIGAMEAMDRPEVVKVEITIE